MSTMVSAAHRLAGMLADLSATNASGIVTVVSTRHRRLFCLDGGWLVSAASNIVEEQFTETIIERGLLTREALAAAESQAKSAEKKITAYLMEQGTPSSDVLCSLMQAYIVDLLGASLEWPDCRSEFSKGTPNLTGEPLARVSCVSVLLEHARHHPRSLEQVRVRIGPPNIRPVVRAEAAERLDPEDIDEPTRYLLENCDGNRDLGQLLESRPGQAAGLLRATHGLLLAGVLVPADHGPVITDSTKKPPTREEVLGRLTMSERANHYAVLGLDPTANQQEIREAYYHLALRFHPDRFRAGELRDLLGRSEEFFSKVTEAYNTLHDKALRAEYDRQQGDHTRPEPEAEQDGAYLARQNYARAKLLIQRRRMQEAVQFLENALSLDESNPLYHIELGRVLIGNPRRRGDAETHLKTAVELDPTSVAALLALGELYRKADRTDDAIRRYREALHWSPSNVEATAALEELTSKGAKRRRGFFRS